MQPPRAERASRPCSSASSRQRRHRSVPTGHSTGTCVGQNSALFGLWRELVQAGVFIFYL
jgi:hypothetical protein